MSDFYTQLITVFIGFFAIMNPVANTPVFLALTAQDAPSLRRKESGDTRGSLSGAARPPRLCKLALLIFQEKRKSTSHEFRGQLNIIIGFTGLLLDEVPGKINDQQRQSLEDILRSGRRLLGLVEEVIDRLPPCP